MDEKKKGADAAKGELQGEGDYISARHYDEKARDFVKEHKGDIPAMAKDAEHALEGSEGDALRKAEAAGKAKAKR